VETKQEDWLAESRPASDKRRRVFQAAELWRLPISTAHHPVPKRFEMLRLDRSEEYVPRQSLADHRVPYPLSLALQWRFLRVLAPRVAMAEA
jgi:hypothetical protein